jgi:4-amino-4-deoxy-L-arabinose transferase-like glycosyltransferase
VFRELTDKQVWILLGLTLFASFFANIWAVPLFDLDEGAFSEATREMFVRGDFMSTFLNGVPRYDKPILIYWLQAASTAIFGFNEFGFRLPSALAASGWVLMIFYFVSRIADRQMAVVAALLTATCVEISVMGKAATADALLNFCITSTMLMYFLHHRFGERRHLYLFFMFMGLGFLTKGPVAIMIPAVVTFLFAAIQRDFKRWLRAVFNPTGILIFCVVALPWYVAQSFKDNGAFLKAFFFKHNLGRFDTAMEKHSGGPFYYVPVVLFGVLPYTAALLLLLRRLPQLIKDELAQYLLLWFAFVFVFFSFSGTKLPHYVVYGYSGICILMALHLTELKNKWLTLLPGQLFLLFLLLVPLLLHLALPAIKDAHVRDMLAAYRDGWPAFYYIVTGSGVLLSLYLTFERRLWLSGKLLLLGLTTVLVVNYSILPAVGGLQQQAVKEAALLVREQGIKEVVQVRFDVPSFNVYSRTISPHREVVPGDYVLTKASKLDKLDYPYQEVFRNNGVALVRLLPAE